MMHSEVAVTMKTLSLATTRTEIDASVRLEESVCGAIRYASGAERLYLSLSAWSKGLQCTEKACKILRKGNLRRQCYDAIEAGRSIRSAV